MTEDPPLHAGDSSEQRRAERLMLDLLQQQVVQPLCSPFVLRTGSGARMEFDAGVDAEGAGLLVAAWAHQGPPKAAQRKKIVGAALKLAYGATLLPGPTRLVLLFSDEQAVAPFVSTRAWYAGAFGRAHLHLSARLSPQSPFSPLWPVSLCCRDNGGHRQGGNGVDPDCWLQTSPGRRWWGFCCGEKTTGSEQRASFQGACTRPASIPTRRRCEHVFASVVIGSAWPLARAPRRAARGPAVDPADASSTWLRSHSAQAQRCSTSA